MSLSVVLNSGHEDPQPCTFCISLLFTHNNPVVYKLMPITSSTSYFCIVSSNSHQSADRNPRPSTSTSGFIIKMLKYLQPLLSTVPGAHSNDIMHFPQYPVDKSSFCDPDHKTQQSPASVDYSWFTLSFRKPFKQTSDLLFQFSQTEEIYNH